MKKKLKDELARLSYNGDLNTIYLMRHLEYKNDYLLKIFPHMRKEINALPEYKQRSKSF